ncbi:hypothetical protein QR680_010216 [Steinernema hermaphroditum]|uniref:Uncharacterized protein n=1 Tax=Steinernema hermaphroditum TaxID=289476 RepID=A0AA39MAA1_9BILA|nr:hypothetical protein QR680_010216 [Steinernema hermaphroditum]
MASDFFSHELYVTLLPIEGGLFMCVSTFCSYAIIRKTPPSIRAHKYYFLYLNTSYQVLFFFLTLFGPIELDILQSGAISVEFSGAVQYLGSAWGYVELFFCCLSVVCVVNAIFVSFLNRYCQVCHPKSFYSRSSWWQITISMGLSAIVGPVAAAMFVLSIRLYSDVTATSTDSEIVFSSSALFDVFLALGVCYIALVVLLSGGFILRVIWKLSQVAQVSKRTREMQKMLTITMLMSAAIPLVFGAIPIFLGVYALTTSAAKSLIIFRIIFCTCTVLGILNSAATLLLVKPYRDFMWCCLKLKKPNKVVSIMVTKVY